MDDAKYLHVAFRRVFGGPSKEELEKTFNQALDWLRYAPNCWILYTRRTPQQWYAALQPLLEDKPSSILIVEVNPAVRSGTMPKMVWDWLKKKR